MVLKKNNLIRPANRKTRMLFCQEKRNRTKEDWKNLFFLDETMVVIKHACKMQIWGKSDKKHVILGTWYFGNYPEIFQQDNASCHALRIVMEYLDKNDTCTLYWPPQSPDLNIIGNIWHMITRKLHKNTKFIKSEQNIIGCFLA